MENLITFLSSLNPFVLLVAGLVGGGLGVFVVSFFRSPTAPKADGFGTEGNDEEDAEEAKQELEHKKMAERFNVVMDYENDDYNIGLITDKKNEQEYLIFYYGGSGNSTVVPLKKKNEANNNI